MESKIRCSAETSSSYRKVTLFFSPASNWNFLHEYSVPCLKDVSCIFLDQKTLILILKYRTIKESHQKQDLFLLPVVAYVLQTQSCDRRNCKAREKMTGSPQEVRNTRIIKRH